MAEVIYETIKDSDGVECFIKRGNLVRCKDCKKKGNSYLCRFDRALEEYGGHRTDADDDWFCADGVAKDALNQKGENMDEIDELEKEVCCETCKYFDIGYVVCRHPIAIKGDVGEKDSCILWWGCD